MDEMSGTGPLRITRHRALPHWYRDQAIYFITFRLHGSIPRHVTAQLLEMQKAYLSALPDPDPNHCRHAGDRWWFGRVEEYLHGSSGMVLDDTQASTVADTIRYHDGQRHDLVAWCVMPNHVHIVTRVRAGWSVSQVVQSWKGYSAREINRGRGSHGALWQREYFEHLVRDEEELWNSARYVLQNPAKARLRGWRWVGVGRNETLAELQCRSLADL